MGWATADNSLPGLMLRCAEVTLGRSQCQHLVV